MIKEKTRRLKTSDKRHEALIAKRETSEVKRNRLFNISLYLLPTAVLSIAHCLLPVACLLSMVFFWSCENDLEKVHNNNDRKPNIEEAFKIESLLSQNGSLRAKLIAPYMLRYSMDTSYLEFPKTLHVNFFDSSGKVESQLDALYGKYLETRSLVYLRDSVVVFNVKGDTLRAPELWWDQNTKKFYTDKLVRIRRKDQNIIGDKGMEATQDLADITIYQVARPSFITVPDSMRAN